MKIRSLRRIRLAFRSGALLEEVLNHLANDKNFTDKYSPDREGATNHCWFKIGSTSSSDLILDLAKQLESAIVATKGEDYIAVPLSSKLFAFPLGPAVNTDGFEWVNPPVFWPNEGDFEMIDNE